MILTIIILVILLGVSVWAHITHMYHGLNKGSLARSLRAIKLAETIITASNKDRESYILIRDALDRACHEIEVLGFTDLRPDIVTSAVSKLHVLEATCPGLAYALDLLNKEASGWNDRSLLNLGKLLGINPVTYLNDFKYGLTPYPEEDES